MKKIIKLENGAVELTILRDGTLVLAEIKRGYVNKKAFLIDLNTAGYAYGIIDKSLKLLEEGHGGQILLATALIQNDPAEVWSHSIKEIELDDIIECVKNEDFKTRELSFFVKEDERIATITSTPKTVLRYPDGRKKQLKDLGIHAVNKLSGMNVVLNPDTKSLLSQIDGSLNRSIYGVISVFPEKTIRSIGKIHGKIKETKALLIEQDVLTESYIELPSNLTVNGFIKSAIIESGGNIVAHLGIENNINMEYASITAEQSIYTSFLKNYPVWAGSNIFVNKYINNCTIQCLDTVATPIVSNSIISVGNKLIVKDIKNKSEIYLSNHYVENEELSRRKSFHQQHKKRLVDIENSINLEKAQLELIRSKVVTQIKKLRKVSENSFGSDLVLNRFYTSLSEGYNKMKDSVNCYAETLDMYQKERLELSFFEQQLHSDVQPEIIVLGRIEPGTVITAPNQIMNVNEELKNVSIKMDTIRGILHVKPL